MSDNLLATIRASSWPDLFDCAFRWYNSHILGLRRPSGYRAVVGKAVHRGAAVFDSSRILGSPITAADAVDATIERLRDPGEEFVHDDEFTPREAEPIAVSLVTRYAKEHAPRFDFVAVEAEFDALDIETQHGTIRVTGTTDRVERHADGSLGIADVKSGARAVGADGIADAAAHHMQMGVYAIGVEATTGQEITGPARIIGMQTTKQARVGTVLIAEPKRALLGNEQAPGLIEIAARMLKAGSFPPNPKSVLCSPKYCAAWDRCPYHA